MMLRSFRFRAALVATCLAGSALVPAVSYARDAGTGGLGDLSEKLSDPGTQLAVSAALVAMSEALMDIDVAPFLRAAEVAGARDVAHRLPPDAKVRDIAGPRAGEMQAELARRTPAILGAAAGMAGALEDMLPQLRALAEKMKGAMKDARPR